MTQTEMLANQPANASTAFAVKPGKLDLIRDRWIYLGLSLLFLVPGLFYIVTNWLNPAIQAPVILGVDFTGGTMLEYGFEKSVNEDDLPKINTIFENKGYHGTIIQIQKPRTGINDKAAQAKQQSAASAGQAQLETPAKQPLTVKKSVNEPPLTLSKTKQPSPITAPAPLAENSGTFAKNKVAQQMAVNDEPTEILKPTEAKSISTIVYIRSKHLQPGQEETIRSEMTQQFGPNTLLQNFSIGPSLASELLQNGLLALLLAYVLIVGYLTFRFEFDYAVCAILSLVHDALFVFGVFAILGHFFHTEIDSMFITAILTVIGFSVHDTIVVYDRLRENSRLYFTKKVPFAFIANLSVNQTLARSISTSTTVLLTLIALYIFGGDTTKDFVFACILGIAVGTYSSIFVATSLLAWMRERREKPALAKA